jgi:GNAT superfamily N-acetyltransferase
MTNAPPTKTMPHQSPKRLKVEPIIRPLLENELTQADRVCRLAYGTYLDLAEPMTVFGDADYVRTRWLADPKAAFCAEVNGELVGSNFATSWGSFGFFGPLTVRPDLWDKGIGKRLLERTMELFESWGTEHMALLTFANSGKHIALYQKFGFWPRFLTPVMSKPVEQKMQAIEWSLYSEVPEKERAKCLDACSKLTSAIYKGLDVRREIHAADAQKLGETVLLWDRGTLVGVAVCQCGAGSEAGSGNCYVKFGAARPGVEVGTNFERLLDACEMLAVRMGMSRLVAGMNMARHEAYRVMIQRGFRIDFQGVAMHKPNEPGYDRPDVFVIDDLR